MKQAERSLFGIVLFCLILVAAVACNQQSQEQKTSTNPAVASDSLTESKRPTTTDGSPSKVEANRIKKDCPYKSNQNTEDGSSDCPYKDKCDKENCPCPHKAHGRHNGCPHKDKVGSEICQCPYGAKGDSTGCPHKAECKQK